MDAPTNDLQVGNYKPKQKMVIMRRAMAFLGMFLNVSR
jgi:hypothetical protein